LALRRKMDIIRTEERTLERPSDDVQDAEWAAMQCAGRFMAGPDNRSRRDLIPISPYDVLGWCGQLLLTLHFGVFKVEGKSQLGTILLSLGVVLIWMSTMQLFIAFRHFGTLVIITRKVMVDDISSFLTLLFITIAGFAQGLWVLDVDPTAEFSNIGYGMVCLFRVVLGEKPVWAKSGADLHTHLEVLAIGYYIVFVVCTSIVLLRLLISMFNETYARVRKKAEEEWRLYWGQSLFKTELRLRLLLPRQYHKHMAIDDPSEVGHAYIFQRLSQNVTPTGAPSPPGSPRKPEVAQRRELDETVLALRSALVTREVELAATKAELTTLRRQLAELRSSNHDALRVPGVVDVVDLDVVSADRGLSPPLSQQSTTASA